jgi:hypothetical protein
MPVGAFTLLPMAVIGFLLFSEAVWNTSRVRQLAEEAFQARIQSITTMAFTIGGALGQLWGGPAYDRLGMLSVVIAAGVHATVASPVSLFLSHPEEFLSTSRNFSNPAPRLVADGSRAHVVLTPLVGEKTTHPPIYLRRTTDEETRIAASNANRPAVAPSKCFAVADSFVKRMRSRLISDCVTGQPDDAGLSALPAAPAVHHAPGATTIAGATEWEAGSALPLTQPEHSMAPGRRPMVSGR